MNRAKKYRRPSPPPDQIFRRPDILVAEMRDFAKPANDPASELLAEPITRVVSDHRRRDSYGDQPVKR